MYKRQIHGYNNNPECHVVIKMEIEDRLVRLVIQDYGKGIENLEQVKTPFYTTAKAVSYTHLYITKININ